MRSRIPILSEVAPLEVLKGVTQLIVRAVPYEKDEHCRNNLSKCRMCYAANIDNMCTQCYTVWCVPCPGMYQCTGTDIRTGFVENICDSHWKVVLSEQ